eukprot:7377794-Prymnesium_polylepis.1
MWPAERCSTPFLRAPGLSFNVTPNAHAHIALRSCVTPRLSATSRQPRPSSTTAHPSASTSSSSSPASPHTSRTDRPTCERPPPPSKLEVPLCPLPSALCRPLPSARALCHTPCATRICALSAREALGKQAVLAA